MQITQTVTRMSQELLPEFSDAHCHLDLFKDPNKIIEESKKNGVGLMIAAGDSKANSLACIKLANGASVFTVIGIGPDFSVSDSEFVDEIETEILKNPQIIGIGEIGLDAKLAKEISIEQQKSIFERQIDIAKSLDLPIVIHSRGAIKEVMRIVESKKVKKAVFHYFEGDEKQAIELACKGYTISIPPFETAKRKRVIKALGINNLVAETDAPVVGKTPIDVKKVVETIANIKGISLEDAASKTTENIRRLFYI